MSPDKSDSEAQGRERVNLASALRDNLVDGVIFIDRNRRLISISSEARHALGLNTNQTKEGVLEVLPEPLRRVIDEALRSGNRIADRKVKLNLPGRGACPLSVNAFPLQAGRNPAGVALLLSDAAPAPQFEIQLEQLDRLASLGTLAASMAHEIKNALVAGKTFIDLLLEKNADAELVEVVRRELGRIDSIVGQMLQFAGPARPTLSTVSLHEILDHSLRLVQHQLDTHLITLDRSFLATSDLVKGEDHALEQAFVNLFLNALEAMAASGTLTVATETLSSATVVPALLDSVSGPQVCITIKDTGVGIPVEHVSRMFEPFFTTKQTGTGLGLPITRRIIQEHRGAIAVDSRPGEGTTFRIILPALQGVARTPEHES